MCGPEYPMKLTLHPPCHPGPSASEGPIANCFQKLKIRQALSALALATIIFACLLQQALADSNYDEGVKLYSAAKYLEAIDCFERAARSSPNNANAQYYAAISYQQLGKNSQAEALYRQIVQRYPATQVASYAKSALKALQGVSIPTTLSGTGYSSPGSAYGSLIAPDETRIYYQSVGDSLVVDASVDNNPVKMIFDTGASITLFGREQLQSMGIEVPKGQPTGMVSGVGGAGIAPIWSMRVDLQVGGISRRNFPIAFADNQSTPILGQTFFNEFDYTINRADNSILFVRKASPYATASGAAPEGHAVPFTTEGNEMVVTAQVNGTPYKMYFDTGAQTTAFGMNDLNALGITVPAQATPGSVSGVSGQSQSYTFDIDSLKLGPIEQYNFSITAVDSAFLPRPLLGQTFYSGWQYTIDNQNNVIRFLRR